jgi:SAM-dependent methyltransferase
MDVDGGLVLDLGCGPGLDVLRIAEAHPGGLRALGIDFRPQQWGTGWKMLARPNVAFVAADAESLPLQDACCDVVWADRLLQHVVDPSCAMVELARVAKPGARIVLADTDHASGAIFCGSEMFGASFMRYRASTIRNASAGQLLSAWCAEVGLKVHLDEAIDIDINDFGEAKELGFFYGGWDEQFRLEHADEAPELDRFLEKLALSDRRGEFRLNGKFHIVAAQK